MDAATAKQLTQRIRATTVGLWELIVTAYQGRAWQALGYPNWDSYCDKELGNMKLKLPKESRREVMCSLRDRGLSLRAIAAATGYDKRTVSRDLAGANAPQQPRAQPRPITGRNGKQYGRCTLLDSFLKTSCTIAKISDRVTKLAGDSGFGTEKERIREGSLRDLRKARDALDNVIAKLEGATV